MRLEDVPMILGGMVVLLGLAFFWDATTEDDMPRVFRERRRRVREERDPWGEVAFAVALWLLGASMIGADRWRYGTVSVLAAVALLAVAMLRNRRYLVEWFISRGAARRGEKRRWPRLSTDGPRRRLVLIRPDAPDEAWSSEWAPTPRVAVPDAPALAPPPPPTLSGALGTRGP